MDEKLVVSDSLELNIKNRLNKIVAHADCSLIDGTVEIKSLYVLQKFRKSGLNDVLLSQILEYAADNAAHKIVAYCGPEPYCPDGQVPLDEEIHWYSEHGFLNDHNVLGVVPCMIKTLKQGV